MIETEELCRSKLSKYRWANCRAGGSGEGGDDGFGQKKRPLSSYPASV